MDMPVNQTTRRPHGVTFAATLQLLLAVSFLIHPIVVLMYGVDAQAAAEAEVERQGFPPDILARNGVSFDKSAGVIVLAVGIAVVLAILAVLNLAGNRTGRILTW